MNKLDKNSIENSSSGILIELNNNKNLLVSFGGINQGLGIPVFEFFNSLKELECDKIFIRDFNQMWYQNGADKNIDSILELRNFLEEKMVEGKYEKVCFMGNSMGGYGAILFGTMLNVHNIISFAPQTFIDTFNRLISFDYRWKKQMNSIHKNPRKVKSFFDLKVYLNKNDNYNSIISIYYSSKHRLDKIHAERLKNIKGVQLFSFKEGGHSVVKTLRDSGKLNILLKEIFN